MKRAPAASRRAGLRCLPLTVVLAGCVACASASPARSGPVAAPATVRVLVYNIHAGKDATGADNLDGVTRVVRETGADIVLLQEVDRMTRRSRGVDQPATLAEKTGFHAAFGNTLHYDGGEYGIAMLSRWPIERDTLVPLPIDPPQERAGGSHEPRGALRAVIASPVGAITVFNTHLDPSQDDHWRRQEADRVHMLVNEARRAGAQLVVAGGDFNSTPESAVQHDVRAAGLRDAWLECGRGQGFTYPADSAVKRIDYLFLTGRIRCTAAEVVATRASDHRPLLVTLSIAPES